MIRTDRQTVDTANPPDQIVALYDALYVHIREAADQASPVGFKVYGVNPVTGQPDSKYRYFGPLESVIIEGKKRRGNSTLDADRGIKAGDTICFIDANSATTDVDFIYVLYDNPAGT
jgi:hypothetical protein